MVGNKKTIIITTHYIEEASQVNRVSFIFLELHNIPTTIQCKYHTNIHSIELHTNIVRNLRIAVKIMVQYYYPK